MVGGRNATLDIMGKGGDREVSAKGLMKKKKAAALPGEDVAITRSGPRFERLREFVGSRHARETKKKMSDDR